MLLCISCSSNYLFFFFLNRQPPLPLPTRQLYINLEFSVWLFFPVTWNFLEVNSEEKCLYSPTLLTLGWRRVFPSDCWYNVKYWQFNGPVTWYVPWRKFGSVVSQLQMSVAFVNRPSRMRIRMLKKKKKEKKNCYGPVGTEVSVLWKMFYFCIQVWGRCFMLEEQTSHPRNFSVGSLVCHTVI